MQQYETFVYNYIIMYYHIIKKIDSYNNYFKGHIKDNI